MVDFHTHILYEIDDGAEDIEMSMALIDALEKQGVKNIVLTPHYYFDKTQVATFIQNRDKKVAKIRERLAGRDITVYAASEVRLTSRTNVEQFSKLAVEGSRYIIVELPFSKEIKPALLQKIDQLIDYTALTPIIAHAEMYAYCQYTPGVLHHLIMQGCLLQLNVSSLFNRRYRALALKMLEKNYIHVLGSDCHNTVTRPPLYGAAAKKILNRFGKDYLERLQHNMHSILKNESITVPAVTPIEKGLFGYK